MSPKVGAGFGTNRTKVVRNDNQLASQEAFMEAAMSCDIGG
jgi:hypothetical protein